MPDQTPLRECDLFPPVKKWLVKQGFEVHVEMFGHDVIGVRGDRVMVVELKLCCSQDLFRQLLNAAKWADWVVGVIASEPRQPWQFRECGYGLSRVVDGKLIHKIKPQQQPFAWNKARKYRFKKLAERFPAMEHEEAGLPCDGRVKRQREKRLYIGADLLNFRFNG